MKEPKKNMDLQHSGFFAFRTPMLPFDAFLSWGDGLEASTADPNQLEKACASDRLVLRKRLHVLITRPEVREALFIASPSMDSQFKIWLHDPDSERGRKMERSLIRYFARMAGRATPFGLFAGCSIGTIGRDTRLTLGAGNAYRRHTRLDMNYLCSLTEALGRQLKQALRYRPNTSLYRAAGRIRYVETRLHEGLRSHHLVAVEDNDYLAATLERAAGGALPDELAQSIVADDPEITREEADEFIEELIDSQILVSELSPAVTGPEPIRGLVDQLASHHEMNHAAQRLEETRRALDAIDGEPLGVEPSRYRAIADGLKELPAPVDLKRLYQMDMVKPAPGATLGKEVVEEIMRGIEILHRLSDTTRHDPLQLFREAFMARYESREVPLVEVLDEEVGIGFDRSDVPGAEASPLLDGLVFPEPPGEETVPWSNRHAVMLRKLLEAGKEMQILLDEEDLEAMRSFDPPPLPDAFAVMASMSAAPEDRDFTIHFRGTSGPSGANLLGRFCHADPELTEYVVDHLRAEEALRPDAVFAEIVHLPEDRIGNILARPVMRSHEIPYLGRSEAPSDRQIPVTDLRVSLAGDRVVLRSATLDVEVIPRLTSAHNIAHPRNLGLYKFLCMLQMQGLSQGLSWSWGALESVPFLPRVVTGRLVLSRARWLITHDELKTLEETVWKWRVDRGLPRFVMLADADNEIPIDFDNVLSVETFVHLVKDRFQAILKEPYPEPDRLCAQGPEGRFMHELVVPFVKKSPVSTPKPASGPRRSIDGERSFPLGSEWLYAKLYTGTSTADQVLRDLVSPLANEITRMEAADQWFFIRYGDPHWHIRLRFHGDKKKLHNTVLPALQSAAEPLLKDSRVWRLQLDTYEREVERYGGLEGTVLAEGLFHADSQAVLEIVEMLSGDEGADARWKLALRGVDLLLEDLGLDLEGKRMVIKQCRKGFGMEFRADDTHLKHQLSEKYRKERKGLEILVDPSQEGSSPLEPGFAVLHRRSRQLEPIIAELSACEQAGRLTHSMAELAQSLIHMHANRMLRSQARAQELVIYDFLNRLYESRAARARK